MTVRGCFEIQTLKVFRLCKAVILIENTPKMERNISPRKPLGSQSLFSKRFLRELSKGGKLKKDLQI